MNDPTRSSALPPPAGACDDAAPASTNTNRAPDGEESRAEIVERLFREHNRALVRFLMTRLHSWSEAQDVAQEAYVKMLQLERFETISFLRAFLFQTAANLALNRLRDGRTSARLLEANPPPDDWDRLSPERVMLAAEEVELLAGYLRELPLAHRQALYLRRIEGLSSAEIAARLRIPERTIRHYIVGALVYCQARLERGAIPTLVDSGETVDESAPDRLSGADGEPTPEDPDADAPGTRTQ